MVTAAEFTAAGLISKTPEWVGMMEMDDSVTPSPKALPVKRPAAYFVEYRRKRKEANGPAYKNALASMTLYSRVHDDPAK